MARSGNGIDIGAVYELLTQLSARIDHMSARMDQMSMRMDQMSARMDQMTARMDHTTARLDSHDRKLDQLLDIANEHRRLLAEHSRRLDDLDTGMTGLRADVGTYHQTVIGHGLHYTDMGERVARVERRLGLDPSGR